MYARIDEQSLLVAELITHNPEGRYHPSLVWVKVPEWLEPYIDNQFWYDGEALNPPSEDYILHKVQARQRQLFTDAFALLEQKSQRPQATVIAALVNEDPVPELDADFVWQTEAIKAENRALLAQLKAATTWEDAELIEPWLPPQGTNPASTPHSSAS